MQIFLLHWLAWGIQLRSTKLDWNTHLIRSDWNWLERNGPTLFGGTGPQSFEAKRPVLLVLFGPFTKPYLSDKAAIYLNFLPYISPCCMVILIVPSTMDFLLYNVITILELLKKHQKLDILSHQRTISTHSTLMSGNCQFLIIMAHKLLYLGWSL